MRVLQAGVRGALGSAITQGIGVATGLQKQFSWTGVAAAGIVGAVSQFSSEKIAGGLRYDNTGAPMGEPPTWQATALSGAAGAIAGAAARSLIDGTDFGDNIMAALPDVIGTTIGNLIAGALAPREPIAITRRGGNHSREQFAI